MFSNHPARNVNEHELTEEHKHLLSNINAERAFRRRGPWKIDSTANAPGYHALTCHDSVDGLVVKKGMTTEELLVFLRGAFHNS